MFSARQHFPKSPPLDISATLRQEFAKFQGRFKPGAQIAVGVGSRGITNLQQIVGTVLQLLKASGAKPFLVPAMGSHGGATPEGQTAILAGYGITEARMEAPIRAGMDAQSLGATEDGVDAFFSTEALHSDGVLVINRVKPHTDFSSDSLGSGVMKMLVVGLGKRRGAANYHLSSSRFGYEKVLRSIARVTLDKAPVLGGVAIVEDQFHQTAALAALLPDEFESRERELFAQSKRLMPRLPFDEMDLLIVDRLGKNISGAGMDPNITGRWVHGYSSMLGAAPQSGPVARRLFVRDLTPETHGNAIGVGLADFTTARLVREMDREVTYINSLTSLTPNCAKIPIYFETDREAIRRALDSLTLSDPREAKIIRIADTLNLEKVRLSEAYSQALSKRPDLEQLAPADDMQFDPAGNLGGL
jgi:hypothetical protein